MNFAAALYISAAVFGVVVATLGLRFGSAPGWSRYRAFAAVGLTAAVFAALDCLWTTDLQLRSLVLASSVQGSVAALHVVSWQWYTRKHLGLPGTRFDRACMAVLMLVAALWLVPGVMISNKLIVLPVPWLGVTYRMPDLTIAGSIANALEVALLGVPLVRYLRSLRDGKGIDARIHVLGLGAIFVCAINDTLVVGELVRSPLLVSVGFLVAVGALGHALTRSFVASIRELDHLSRGLERLVGERTDALLATEATLFRTEKMAALGQLAAGVAHEINNPAAAVEANLAYLRDALDEGAMPSDGRECVDESLQAIARITKIVSQLLDSGRAAAHARSGGGNASVRGAVQEAIATARPHFGDHIVTSINVIDGLSVRADASSLVQVVVNLVVNAAQAMPAGRGHGTVAIRTSIEEGRVHIAVVDDGSGMSEETKRRIFEPFFTTKTMGKGTGLGLSVSLGLLRSMGGDLLVDSGPKGTTMTIVLDAGEGEPTTGDRVAGKRNAIVTRDAS